MSLYTMLRTKVTLQSKATTNQQGGQKPAWSNVASATNVRADVQSASSNIRAYWAEKHMNCTHTVFLKQNIGARADDRLLSNGRNFKVLGYVPQSIGYTEWPNALSVEEELLPPN